MRTSYYAIVLIAAVLLLYYFWPLLIVLLLALGAFLLWNYYKARKTINKWQNQEYSEPYSDYRASSGDVIDAEYKEKEVD